MNLLIDGSSLLWRSHFANKAAGRSGAATNTHLFLKSLKSYSSEYNCKNIYIAWDKKLCDEKNFRQTSTDGDYKGNRNKDDAVEVYAAQPQIHEVTQTLGCKNLYPRTMEADDIIAWLSKTLDGNNIIVTTDNDMLQLVNTRTCVFHPKKKHIIDHNNFESIVGMPVEHYLPYKAILGDASDNIRGVDGCGPVGSKRLAKKWVEKQHIDEDKVVIIEKNIKLMDLNIGYTLGGIEEELSYKEQLKQYSELKPDMGEFIKLCKEYEFNSILNDIHKWKNTFEKSCLLDFFDKLTI